MNTESRKSFIQRMHTLPSYGKEATEFAFLLGGIGTGNVSVGSRGQLKDWEIFNCPGKGNRAPYTFFAIHTRCGNDVQNRILEGPLLPPFSGSNGINSADLGGLPRMQSVRMKAEYPLCAMEFTDDKLPVTVCMEAYTPFIPLNPKDSGLPCAILRYRVQNHSEAPAFVSIAGTLDNMTTIRGYNAFEYPQYQGDARNIAADAPGLHGVKLESVDFESWHPMHASMVLATTGEQYIARPNLLMGTWWDGIQDFWDDFTEDGRLESESAETGHTDTEILKQKRQHICALTTEHTIAPGEEHVFEFLLTWYFPNRIHRWEETYDPKTVTREQTIRNHYALDFADAWDVAGYVCRNMDRLERDTFLFHETFFGGTLPVEFLDAASANITVLRSPTCFWLENNLLMGWEGCFDQGGCCLGNCTHVWNYEQTVGYLFPQLAQTMRKTEFHWETDADGRMNFRALRMLEDRTWDMYPAPDGQLGAIVHLYREYRLSGNADLLDALGETALKALDFSIRFWDQDGDGVLESQQHNTYDIEFYGINSMTNTLYYAGLLAGAQIADILGQVKRAERYSRLAKDGAAKMDAMLWNGEYYEQRIEDVNYYKYQFGKGVLSDQLLGQYAAFMAGLGYVLPENHVRGALQSIFRYNMRRDFSSHSHVQRTYAVGGESGLLLCSWPYGGRPRFPFVYSDEVWTGIEYQVAATMLCVGLVDEALEIVRGVRGRYQGSNRNPFNEVECGHHYVRSMASWGLIVAASGFACHFGRQGALLSEGSIRTRLAASTPTDASGVCCGRRSARTGSPTRRWSRCTPLSNTDAMP